MAFPKKQNQQAQEPEIAKDYVTVGAVWSSAQYEGFSVSLDEFFGEVYFRRKLKDENGNEIGEQFYKLKRLNLLEPKDFGKGIPEGLQYRISVNLANPKAAELQDSGDQPAEAIPDEEAAVDEYQENQAD